MAKKAPSVDDFLKTTKHKRLDEVQALRAVILGATKGLTEHIKWNAPSFCSNGDDRVTMRLQPGDRLELIFHRGAKVKDAKTFEFKDTTGLLDFVAKDRAVLRIADAKDLKTKKLAIAKLVNAWVKATED